MGRQQGQPRTSEATESGPIMRYIAKTSALTNQPRIKPVMKSSYFVFLGIICWLIIFKSAIFFFQSRRTVYLHAIERKGAPSDNLLAFSSPLYPPQIKKKSYQNKKKKKGFQSSIYNPNAINRFFLHWSKNDIWDTWWRI